MTDDPWERDHPRWREPVRTRTKTLLLDIAVTVLMLVEAAAVLVVVGIVLLFILSHSTPTCGIAATGPNC